MEWDPDPFYTSVCSAATIQSNKRGFFFDYADHVTETAGSNWVEKVFGNLKTDTERIQILLNDKKVSSAVCGTLQHVTQLYRSKDARVSRARREEGDAAMRSGYAQKAVALYSQAVLRAPPTGVDVLVDGGLSLPLALWSRAGALLISPPLIITGAPDAEHATQGGPINGALALGDLQLALKVGMPASQRAELYWRMGKCYREMAEIAKAKVSYGLADRLLGTNDEARQRLGEDMQALEREAQLKKKPQDRIFKETPTLTKGENPSLPGASSLVQVSDKTGAGRLVVAADHINTGDTILVEKPLAACLLPEFCGTHCYHCLERLAAPVGCPDCSGVAFCSVVCRDIATNSYHQHECKFLDLLIGSGMSILCHVALRMVTQCGGVDEALAKSGGTTSTMCTHSERRGAKDHLHRALMAIFLARCLQKSGFFGNQIETDNQNVAFDAQELKIAAVLLHYLQLLQFNAHEIYETKLGVDHRFRGSKVIYIGVAIYSTAALFNHECYPAVTRYFVGRSIVLRALRPLAPGAVVAENYGPIFTKRTKAERQRALASRYWFKCSCQACLEDWPTYPRMDNHAKLRCPTEGCPRLLGYPADLEKRIKCLGCKKQVSLRDRVKEVEDCEEQYKDGVKEVEAENPKAAIAIFRSALNSFAELAVPPHKDTHVAEEALRACLADEGNVYRTPVLIKPTQEKQTLTEPPRHHELGHCKIVEITD